MGGGAMATASNALKAASASAAAARAAWFGRAVKTTAASISVTEHPVTGSVTSSEPDYGVAAETKRNSGLGEWELAGAGEERTVFGPVPSLDEAREAAADLKSALELAYFAPTADRNDLTDPAVVSTTSSVCSENLDSANELLGIFPSYPTHIVQAFSFLQENPRAQEVVASLASDKNVWDAVMRNEMVMEFYKTHRIYASFEGPEEAKLETSPGAPDPTVEAQILKENNLNGEETQKPAEEAHAPGLKGFVEFIRVKLEDMANKLSGFVKDIMGGIEAGSPNPNKTPAGPTGGAAAVELSLGAAFVALAIATILTILFKRG